jgi:3-methyladenine DNA glycosylase/8-oxoguanine DNA glycosylase
MRVEVDEAHRVIRVEGPYDLLGSVRPIIDGGTDPTWASERRGDVQRAVHATWTPEGAATIEMLHAGGDLVGHAFGPGAGWVLDRLEALSGSADDPGGFEPDIHPRVSELRRRFPGLRLARSPVLWDVLVPTVLGQRVTTAEARRSWRQLVRRFGHEAPGSEEVRLPPRPETVARLGDADWHRMGVERRRADAVRGLVRVLGALERIVDRSPAAFEGSAATTAELRRVVESVRGVGPWTSTALAAAVLADPDVVLLGDLHLPNVVCHELAREARGDDTRMLELLEPFRPHRGRVVRLIKASGRHAPRFGPHYTPLAMRDL